MSFGLNLSKISKFVFLFGISPFSFNKKSNKFECSLHTFAYTLCYFLFVSIAIILLFIHELSDQITYLLRLETTFTILSLLQQSTIMIIFITTSIDLMVKREKHANFLNNLIELDSNLLKLNIKSNNGDLSTLQKQNFFIVFYFVTIVAIDFIRNTYQMEFFQHL